MTKKNPSLINVLKYNYYNTIAFNNKLDHKVDYKHKHTILAV